MSRSVGFAASSGASWRVLASRSAGRRPDLRLRGRGPITGNREHVLPRARASTPPAPRSRWTPPTAFPRATRPSPRATWSSSSRCRTRRSTPPTPTATAAGSRAAPPRAATNLNNAGLYEYAVATSAPNGAGQFHGGGGQRRGRRHPHPALLHDHRRPRRPAASAPSRSSAFPSTARPPSAPRSPPRPGTAGPAAFSPSTSRARSPSSGATVSVDGLGFRGGSGPRARRHRGHRRDRLPHVGDPEPERHEGRGHRGDSRPREARAPTAIRTATWPEARRPRPAAAEPTATRRSNDQNTGGGGGGNWGTGGQGGHGWLNDPESLPAPRHRLADRRLRRARGSTTPRACSWGAARGRARATTRVPAAPAPAGA